MAGIICICQVCSKRVKGSLGVSSNYIKHLKNKHPQKFLEFQSQKKNVGRTQDGKIHLIGTCLILFATHVPHFQY